MVSISGKFKASGLKKQIWSNFWQNSLIFEKFNINTYQKNSDRTIEQPSCNFRDKIYNAAVNNVNTF